jgi:hypothetical protein
MTELFLHGGFAGEQTELGTMEAGAKQFVDRGLEILGTMKNPNRFTHGTLVQSAL